MPTCEYCGEDFTKGGAYATHVRYCDDRPETEEGDRSDAEADDGDVSEEVSDEGIAIEISESGSQTRSVSSETAESERPRATPGREESHRDAGDGSADERSTGRWLAALVLIIVVAVVLRLLGSDDD